MSKIYDLTPSYRIGRRYVNPAFRQFYSKFIVLNKENIPTEGPVIFAPNHLNALMDALVILSSTPYKLSNVFIARSDIFKKGFFAKALRFLKILPAFRIRDGYENLGKNDATFDAAREVLEERNALCVMPEGNQGDQRKLRPFAKGIFRIAFTSQEQIGDKAQIKLIPVGIDYSDRTKFGEEVIANYGSPLLISDYMPLYAENPAVAINKLRADLKTALHAQTVDIATNTHYECFETAVMAADRSVAQSMFGKQDSASRFYARQKIAERLVEMEGNDEAKTEMLTTLCSEYKKLNSNAKLTADALDKPKGFFALFFQTLGLLLTLPIFLCGLVLNMFPFFLPGFIRKRMGVKYDGFFSSFDFVLGAVFTFPLCYLIQTILFAVLSPTPWWCVLVFAVSQFVLGKAAFTWYTSARKYTNRLRYHFMKASHPNQIEEIQKLREEIIEMAKC